MFAICDEFEFYGYRRVGAALRQQGLVINHKKIRRLMRQHDLHPKVRRRFVATTDSNHDGLIFPNLAKDIVPTGPNQLWVSDITYVALPTRFIYVAVVLDVWSRLIVGYAVSRSIDARLKVAALKAAIERRRPPTTGRSPGLKELNGSEASAARSGLDRRQLRSLAQGEWLKAHEHLILTGQTGTVKKTWLACARHLTRYRCIAVLADHAPFDMPDDLHRSRHNHLDHPVGHLQKGLATTRRATAGRTSALQLEGHPAEACVSACRGYHPDLAAGLFRNEHQPRREKLRSPRASVRFAQSSERSFPRMRRAADVGAVPAARAEDR